MCDDSWQILQAIREFEKAIDEDASIIRLQKMAAPIEARVQKVTARRADGPPITPKNAKNGGSKRRCASCCNHSVRVSALLILSGRCFFAGASLQSRLVAYQCNCSTRVKQTIRITW